MTITTAQSRRLHQLLNELKMMESKADLVGSFSNNRTTSSKELTLAEARELILYLERKLPPKLDFQPKEGDAMRRKIFAICRSLGYIYGNKPADYKMNQTVVYGIVQRKGYLKPKPLMQYTEQELVKLVSQFEQMETKRDLSAAKREVDSLLKELNLVSTD